MAMQMDRWQVVWYEAMVTEM
jgi:hypothetical protein